MCMKCQESNAGKFISDILANYTDSPTSFINRKLHMLAAVVDSEISRMARERVFDPSLIAVAAVLKPIWQVTKALRAGAETDEAVYALCGDSIRTLSMVGAMAPCAENEELYKLACAFSRDIQQVRINHRVAAVKESQMKPENKTHETEAKAVADVATDVFCHLTIVAESATNPLEVIKASDAIVLIQTMNRRNCTALQGTAPLHEKILALHQAMVDMAKYTSGPAVNDTVENRVRLRVDKFCHTVSTTLSSLRAELEHSKPNLGDLMSNKRFMKDLLDNTAALNTATVDQATNAMSKALAKIFNVDISDVHPAVDHKGMVPVALVEGASEPHDKYCLGNPFTLGSNREGTIVFLTRYPVTGSNSTRVINLRNPGFLTGHELRAAIDSFNAEEIGDTLIQPEEFTMSITKHDVVIATSMFLGLIDRAQESTDLPLDEVKGIFENVRTRIAIIRAAAQTGGKYENPSDAVSDITGQIGKIVLTLVGHIRDQRPFAMMDEYLTFVCGILNQEYDESCLSEDTIDALHKAMDTAEQLMNLRVDTTADQAKVVFTSSNGVVVSRDDIAVLKRMATMPTLELLQVAAMANEL